MSKSFQRCSILVRAAGSEKGPKNPLKGIAMKPVVPASNANLGWVLEGRLCFEQALRYPGALQWHGEVRSVYRGDLFTCWHLLPILGAVDGTAQEEHLCGARNLQCGR